MKHESGRFLSRQSIVCDRESGGFLVNGFKLILPTADYYTADGKLLDQIGVTPTIHIPQEKALDYILQEVSKR